MVKIILLGRCCRVSFDMIKLGLKSETSLFEWVWTNTLTEINTIIQKLIDKIPIETVRKKDDNNNWNDYLVDTNIVTSHYIQKDYNEIVQRRSQRFLNDIRTHTEILFIRDDVKNTICLEEIAHFFELIERINPQLNCKMLLLSEKEHYTEIVYPNLHYRIYDVLQYKKYITECFSIDDNPPNTNINDLSDEES